MSEKFKAGDKVRVKEEHRDHLDAVQYEGVVDGYEYYQGIRVWIKANDDLLYAFPEDSLEIVQEGVPGSEVEGTNVFIQYKGTDLCADFYCDCGTHLHYDGYFAYAVKCGECGSVWEMPQMVTMRKVESSRWTPILLEKDED